MHLTYLVVLRVGGLGLNGDGLRAQPLNVGHLALIRRRLRGRLDLDEPLRELAPDADADESVRQVAAIEKCV